VSHGHAINYEHNQFKTVIKIKHQGSVKYSRMQTSEHMKNRTVCAIFVHVHLKLLPKLIIPWYGNVLFAAIFCQSIVQILQISWKFVYNFCITLLTKNNRGSKRTSLAKIELTWQPTHIGPSRWCRALDADARAVVMTTDSITDQDVTGRRL